MPSASKSIAGSCQVNRLATIRNSSRAPKRCRACSDCEVRAQMLSILMPVYNERERVERAIAEVLATELPDEFELIVVNDGSTDGTSEILRDGDWDGRVRLFEHDHNQGKGAAIQTALTHARGDFAAIF